MMIFQVFGEERRMCSGMIFSGRKRGVVFVMIFQCYYIVFVVT